MTRSFPILVSLFLMAGCTQFPDLEAAETAGAARADYPQLVPLGPVLAGVDVDVTIDETVPQSLAARAAALRARAARLRGSPLGDGERARLRDAGARNAARIAGG